MKITRSQLKKIIKEAASEYVWGVKGPARIANQYKLSTLKLKKLINEEVNRVLREIEIQKPDTRPAGGKTEPAGGDTAPPGAIRRDKITPGDIEDLEQDITQWTKQDKNVLDQAAEIGVQVIDPNILIDAEKVSQILYDLMAQKRAEDLAMQYGPPPGE